MSIKLIQSAKSSEEVLSKIKEIGTLLEKARKDFREIVGGIKFVTFTGITDSIDPSKDYGLYIMNVPTNEAAYYYFDRGIVENQKLLQAIEQAIEIGLKEND